MKTVALGEVVEINPSTPKIDPDVEVNFVGMADLDIEAAQTDSAIIRPYSEVSKGYTVFADGDILVAKITPCFENNKIGQARLKRSIGVGSTEFHVMRPSARIHDRYLLHFLRQDWIRHKGELRMTGSAGQRRVPANFLESLDLPLPSLDEQHRIAAIIDHVDSLRTKQQSMLSQLDSLATSTFSFTVGVPLVDWPTISLSDCADIITGYAFPSSQFIDSGIRLCRGANVLPGRLDWSDVRHWPQANIADIDRFRLSAGDIIVALDRPWISTGFKLARVQEADTPSLLVQRVARVRANDPNAQEFLYGVISSPAFRAHCSPTETTIPHISPVELRDFTFQIPPDHLLQKFQAQVTNITLRRKEAVALLATVNELSTSLQSRAFRGEL